MFFQHPLILRMLFYLILWFYYRVINYLNFLCFNFSQWAIFEFFLIIMKFNYLISLKPFNQTCCPNSFYYLLLFYLILRVTFWFIAQQLLPVISSSLICCFLKSIKIAVRYLNQQKLKPNTILKRICISFNLIIGQILNSIYRIILLINGLFFINLRLKFCWVGLW